MVIKICAHDAEKMNHICISNTQLFVEQTHKSIKKLDRSIKKIAANPELNSIEKKRLVELIDHGKNQHLSVAKNEISAVSCIENTTQPFDQLYVLHPAHVVLEKKLNMPVTPIEIAKGKCKKLVKKSFLKTLYQPEEMLIDLTKSTLEQLRENVE